MSGAPETSAAAGASAVSPGATSAEAVAAWRVASAAVAASDASAVACVDSMAASSRAAASFWAAWAETSWSTRAAASVWAAEKNRAPPPKGASTSGKAVANRIDSRFLDFQSQRRWFSGEAKHSTALPAFCFAHCSNMVKTSGGTAAWFPAPPFFVIVSYRESMEKRSDSKLDFPDLACACALRSQFKRFAVIEYVRPPYDDPQQSLFSRSSRTSSPAARLLNASMPRKPAKPTATNFSTRAAARPSAQPAFKSSCKTYRADAPSHSRRGSKRSPKAASNAPLDSSYATAGPQEPTSTAASISSGVGPAPSSSSASSSSEASSSSAASSSSS
mmetsp:Transcript_13579/g.47303  ORF Transcript_13579/g.47303 Transcript_13579/m.47303 type:complete len:332 (+) Transcript_13579:654-1649(+)